MIISNILYFHDGFIMKNFELNDIKRKLKLPFKFIYLILCVVFAITGFLFLLLPTSKKRHQNKNTNEVLVVSHVSISFDGRIKKCANELVKLGKKVTLIKPIDAQENNKYEYTGLDKNVVVHKIGLSGVFAYFPCIFDICMFFYMVRSKAKYLHCHDINTAFMGLIAAKITGKIIVADLHEWKSECSTVNKETQHPLQVKIFKQVEKIILQQADYVISVNETIANEMMNCCGVKREILIVRNSPLSPELKPYNIREQLPHLIPSHFFIAYYVGQLAPYRNIDQIIKAIANCKDIALVIQGTIDDNYFKNLNSLIKNLNLIDKVFFLPAVPYDFIPSACQGADVGIFTCNSEAKSMFYSLPNKIFEYIVGEIPIISENLPVAKEYIEKNNIGKLINSNNYNEISKALTEYQDNRKELMQHKNNVIHLKNNLFEKNENYLPYKKIYNQ